MTAFGHKVLGVLSALSVASGLAFLPGPWGKIAIGVGTFGAFFTSVKKALTKKPIADVSGSIPSSEQ